MKPSKIHLHKQSQILDLCYESVTFSLTAEYLRVHSPSAEVKGHAGAGGELPFGKQNVRINKILPAGNYALKIEFDDGHNSGLYSWEYLYLLASEREAKWDTYLNQLHASNKTRLPNVSVVKLIP